jgi:hypothetical protein
MDRKAAMKEFNRIAKQNASQHRTVKEMSLTMAYNIVGGYTDGLSEAEIALYFNSANFERAKAMVMADDPAFAKALLALEDRHVSFAAASNDDLRVAEDVAYGNAKNICEEYTQNADSLKKEVCEDSEVQEAVQNSPLEANNEADVDTLFAAAQNDVLANDVENDEYAKVETAKKHSYLVGRIKNAFLHTLGQARANSTTGGKENIKDAFNFKKRMHVTENAVKKVFLRSENKVSRLISRLKKFGKTKVAAYVNKAKTAVRNSAFVGMMMALAMPNVGCTGNSQRQDSDQAKAKTEYVKDSSSKSQDVQEIQVQKGITVPTEWNENMNITKAQWNRLQDYWPGERATFEKMYKNIPDSLLNGKTREQFLFALERHASWGLTAEGYEHKDDVAYVEAALNPCDTVHAPDLMAEDVAFLDMVTPEGYIKDIRGNANVRVTGREGNPCDGYKTKIQKTKAGTKTQTPKTTQTSDDFVNGTLYVTTDSVSSEHGEFTNGTMTRNLEVSDTVYVQERPIATIYKTNGTTLQSGDTNLGNADVSKVDSTKTNDNRVLVEQGDKVSSASQQQGIALFSMNETTDSVSVTGDATNSVSAAGSANASSTSGNVLFSMKEDSVSTNGKVLLKLNPDENTNATSVSTEGTSSVSTTGNTDVTVNQTAESGYTIVVDSPDVPDGTPSAGYVEERGGYNNSGVREEQLVNATKYFGENFVDQFYSRIDGKDLQKGGAFAGWTKEEALVTSYVLCKVFPPREASKAINTYFNHDCHDVNTQKVIPEDVVTLIYTETSKVNKNQTIDGVTYYSPRDAQKYLDNGCDKTPGAKIITTRGGFTKPGGEKFERFFMIQNAAPEAFVEGGTLIVEKVVNQTVTVSVSDKVTELKTNGTTVDVQDKVVKDNLTLSDVNASLTGTNNTKVLVQNGDTGATKSTKLSKKEQKARAKAAKKEAERKAKETRERLAYWQGVFNSH